MSNALTIGCTIGLGVYVIGMIAILQYQWHKLKCSDVDSALTAGIARTVADLLAECDDPVRVARLVERDRFRSVKVSAFMPNGDVILDSATPCATRDLRPTTATSRQSELFRAILSAEERKSGTADRVVSGTLYRPCDPHGSGDAQLTTFSSTRSADDVVVVATSCG